MNDIEIINQVIYTEQGEKMNYIDIDNVIDDDCKNFIQAIENLIQRNKDLEQIEKEHKEENGRLRDRIKELEEEKEKEFKRGFFTKVAENKVNTLKIESQVIPKSLVREKMNKIKEEDLEISNTDSEDVRIAKYEQIAILDFCEELLEENEK